MHCFHLFQIYNLQIETSKRKSLISSSCFNLPPVVTGFWGPENETTGGGDSIHYQMSAFGIRNCWAFNNIINNVINSKTWNFNLKSQCLNFQENLQNIDVFLSGFRILIWRILQYLCMPIFTICKVFFLQKIENWTQMFINIP